MDLQDKYLGHLLSNHLAVPADLSAYLQDLICQQNHGWKGCRPTDGKRYLGLEDVIRWGRTILNSIGLEFASQEEAERRASICAGCRYQTEISGVCSVCSGLPALMLKLISGKSTSQDEKLKHCQFCGCLNKAAVHYPLEALQKASAGVEWPADTRQDGGPAVPCWKR